ncbi:MAG TPA: hypothetical protein VGK84_05725, partial [Candidatus Tumulicola sp.]
WWKCHRRLIADAASLLHGFEVLHLMHDGKLPRTCRPKASGLPTISCVTMRHWSDLGAHGI